MRRGGHPTPPQDLGQLLATSPLLMPTECTRYSTSIGIKKIETSGDLNFQKRKIVVLSPGGFTITKITKPTGVEASNSHANYLSCLYSKMQVNLSETNRQRHEDCSRTTKKLRNALKFFFSVDHAPQHVSPS